MVRKDNNDKQQCTDVKEKYPCCTKYYVSTRLEYNQMYIHVKSVYNYTMYIYVPSITYIPVANNG